MKRRMRCRILQVVQIIELAMSALIALFLVIQFIKLSYYSFNSSYYLYDSELVCNFLKGALDIVVGIEFVKLLLSYSINLALEVLVIAIARHLLVSNESPLEMLILIIVVGVLTIIKSYCEKSYTKNDNNQENASFNW